MLNNNRKCSSIGYMKRKSNGKFTVGIEFASVIWNPHQGVYKDDIESVQKQFMIDLMNSRKNASSYRIALYAERWKTLNLRTFYLLDNFSGHINES